MRQNSFHTLSCFVLVIEQKPSNLDFPKTDSNTIILAALHTYMSISFPACIDNLLCKGFESFQAEDSGFCKCWTRNKK